MSIYKVFLRLNLILKKILLKLMYGKRLKWGKKFFFRRRFNVWIEKDGQVLIGDNCFFNNDCSINSHKLIKIGKECIIGEGVKIYDHNHIFRNLEIPVYKQGFCSEEVIIGNNCWIGSNVIILKGVKIGDNCVIGANCLIYKSIEKGSIIKCNNILHVDKVKGMR